LLHIEARGRKVACFKKEAVHKNTSAAPIVFLHGFPDNLHSWKHQMNLLAAQGHTSYAPALRGYGPDDAVAGEDFSILNLALDVLAIVEALQLGESGFHLVGHDWGSVIASHAAKLKLPSNKVPKLLSLTLVAVPDSNGNPLSLALRQPAQLIMSWYMFFFQLGSGIPEWWLRTQGGIETLWSHWGLCVESERLEAVIKTLTTAGPERNMGGALAYYRLYVIPSFLVGTPLRRPVADGLAWLHGLASPSTTEDFAIANHGIASLEELMQRPITVPTLLLVGEHDGCISPDIFVASQPHHRIVKVPKAGHFLQHEQPTLVGKLIAQHVAL